MTRRLLVSPAPSSALDGDEPIVVDLDGLDSAFRIAGRGVVTTRGAADEGEASSAPASATLALVTPLGMTGDGRAAVEVVVDGWRFELLVEDAARAELRRRATRAPDAATASGPLDIRAIIPGRVAAIRVVVGDVVEAGQSLLVVEAMKMQNELRAPRAGTVERVAVVEGGTIDNGDLLVVVR